MKEVKSVKYLGSNEIASCYWNMDCKSIKIRNLETGKIVRKLVGHTDSIQWIEVLSNNQIVSCSNDNSIRVWNFQTGDSLKQLNGHTDSVIKVKALPNSQKLVSISEDKTIKVWDLDIDSCVKTIISRFQINDIDIVSDSQIVLSYKAKKQIKTWDLNSGECLQRFVGHTEHVDCIKVLPNNTMISSNIGESKLWNLTNGSCIKNLDFNSFFKIEIISNEQIAVYDYQGTSVRNIISEKCIKKLDQDVDGNSDISVTDIVVF